MKAFRISGTHRITKERHTINVFGIDLEDAWLLMSADYYRLLCLDKQGVELW